MTTMPIIGRELRVSSRKRATHLSRLILGCDAALAHLLDFAQHPLDASSASPESKDGEARLIAVSVAHGVRA